VNASTAPSSLTIVHVAAPAPVGGLEAVVTALARGQAARGHMPHIVSVFNAGERAFGLGDGLPGVITHMVRVAPRRYGRERAAVLEIARQSGAQVVHTHGYRPDVIDSGVARTLGVPAVTTVHGFTGGGLKNRIFEHLQRRAFRRFDAVVAVSRPQVSRLERRGVPPDRIHCVPNGWAPVHGVLDRAAARSRLGLPADGPIVGWVGRLSREKAPDVFLDALGVLGAGAPGAAFIGDGPLAVQLRQRAEALGLHERVRWCGRVDGAAALIPAFDAFVLSSRTEGTPIALLEAMAAGVPVIATTVGGVPDVVSETEALLVAAEDVAGLARAIHGTLADPGRAAGRAAAARVRLDREFALGPWLDKYERIYRDVIGRHP
jgi:glycosyltransferase involved in cell wall biosynthesis